MSQTFSFNGYTHEPDACWFTIDRMGILGGTNRLNKIRNIWTIFGRVSGATAGAVDAKVQAWENSVADGGDCVFSLGGSMNLRSSDCTEGTHVKSFSWLSGFDGVHGSGAEGIRRRTFKLVVYGDKLHIGSTDITFWQERLSSIGNGGAKIVPVPSLAGLVQAQQVEAQTPFYAIQTGTAIGLTHYPAKPLPIYLGVSGVYYFPETMATTLTTPRSWGLNINLHYTTNWSYKCWSANGLLGNPTSTF